MRRPVSAPLYATTIKNFNGVDFRNAPQKVVDNRSPNAVNMIRDTIGNNRKRHGYKTVKTFEGRINGMYILKTSKLIKIIVHAGSKIYNYENGEVLYSDANDVLSSALQVAGKIYIFDKKALLVYDGEKIIKASEGAYVPTILIGKEPKGGGKGFEPINLLSPWRKERFVGTDTDKVYQVSTIDLDEDLIKVEILQEDGSFKELVEKTDFTVDRKLGTVTFTAAHKTPVDGKDSVYISYAKTVEGYADRINKCDVITLYGTSGSRDRIFCAGNDEFKNYDWYSKDNDPTMWGDTWYCVTGQDDASITGYSILNDRLVIHKNSQKNENNAIIRDGEYSEALGQVAFRTTGAYPAVGALSKHSFQTIGNEPLYLTIEKNISAITTNELSTERFSQERSYYLTEKLKLEENLAEAYACTFDNFYMLAVNDKMYILDASQVTYEKNAPYATRQFEGYYFDHIGARILKPIDNELYFGTDDGIIKKFMTDKDVDGFVDDGTTHLETIIIDGQEVTTEESFKCYWDTAEIYGNHEELKKTFKHIAVCLNPYVRTGCRIWAKVDGIWEVIFDYDTSANFFDFSNVDFSNFTFRTDNTPTAIGGKFKAKNLLHIQLRFENSKPEPFSLLWAKLKYTVKGEFIK